MILYGGIEAGGTKFVCAIGTTPENVIEERIISTTTPKATIAQVISFFSTFQNRIAGIGVGSFGPIDINPSSPTFGYITNTPKPEWKHTPLIKELELALRVPFVFDTDANAAALAEATWGSAMGLRNFVYITVGTGIGGGIMVEGKILHGLLHPEIGHMRLPHDWKDDPFLGLCPYHGDCLEGLAAGPALAERWGTPAVSLPLGHRAWKLEAHYLGLALVNIIFTVSPQRIILGGGIMHRETLLPDIRKNVMELMNGYLEVRELKEDVDEYITSPKLKQHAGVLGAIALVKEALTERRRTS
jgi:fructokinase